MKSIQETISQHTELKGIDSNLPPEAMLDYDEIGRDYILAGGDLITQDHDTFRRA